jgi:hypothetical protein
MVDWTGKEAYESDIRGYFPCCPICGANRLTVHLTDGGRDAMSCENCGAQWHVYVGVMGLKWAELDVQAHDGKGSELVGKRVDKKEWKRMSQVVRNTLKPENVKEPKETIAKEREVIREKEVIVKIRCSYCHNLYDETLDKCPHCGAKR